MRATPLLLLFLAACAPVAADDDDSRPADDDDAAPEVYAFDSRFEGGSSVSYSGQTMRQALIVALADRIDGMTERVDTGWVPAPGDVVGELMAYYAFDGASSGSLEHGVATDPAPLQTTWDDIAEGKDLRGKLAGNDPVGHHLDYGAGFVGWDAADVSTPDDLVLHWFDALEALVIDRANGATPPGPDGAPIPRASITPEGQDLEELLAKFVAMAVCFSQGTDDYLDDSQLGKGLLSDHSGPDDEDGGAFTALEHAWDEGFGYFGAPRDFGAYSDDEIASAGGRPDWQGMHDSDGDGAIDLGSERIWGHAANAGKRDRGAAEATDFSQEAWDAFLGGRALIAAADGPLDEAELAELGAYRDAAVRAWEGAIAATAVHYINEVLVDMAAFGTADYDFGAHSKHWSELKGFTLGLQFNPRSPLLADFAAFHALIGQAPALPDAGSADAEAYADALLEARALLGDAYGFSDANLGGDDGHGGW